MVTRSWTTISVGEVAGTSRRYRASIGRVVTVSGASTGLVSSPWFWGALLAVLLGYNAYVTVSLVRAHFYTRRQKLTQLLLLWLVPVLGATCVHWFVRHGTGSLPRSDREFVAQEKPPLGVRG